MIKIEGVKKIQEKIINDAKKEAKSITEAANKKIESINQKARDNAENVKKEGRRAISSEVKLSINKGIAMAKVKAKREYMVLRENIINNLIEEAVSEMKRSSKQYKDFLKASLVQGSKDLSGRIKVLVAKKDKATVSSLAKKAKVSCTVAENDIKCGIIMQSSSGMRIDNSLSSLIEDRKAQIRKEVTMMLEK